MMFIEFVICVIFAIIVASFGYGYVNEPYGRSKRVQIAETLALVGVVALLGVAVYSVYTTVRNSEIVTARMAPKQGTW